MGTLTLEQDKHLSLSPQQRHEEIIAQTKANVVDALKEYSDEFQHIKYFIEAEEGGSEEDRLKGEQYIRLTLDPPDSKTKESERFQKFINFFKEKLNRLHKENQVKSTFQNILEYLKAGFYDKISEELVMMPDFKGLA